ncbi:UDP-glucose 4-epimerase GalE [Halomonas sp. 328]|uniref:UDP-glucose 4-epimerase GalE n=1 Tax=Halomonas sp. 328 TaxID=2776704 RepID=UPI002DDA36F5|nr:UDP-glucose 4-epimerase GalE [Halomonas sp. 328]
MTGGAGYLGSHTVLALLEAGHRVVVLDSLINGHREALARVTRLTGRDIDLVAGDIRDTTTLARLFSDYPVSGVIHFAGLKSVAGSVAAPAEFFDVNVRGSQVLFHAMRDAGVRTLLFSSSATVYGLHGGTVLHEGMPHGRPASPYAATKQDVETWLTQQGIQAPSWSIGLLRYFNPVGAHESGLIGEDPLGKPTNLMPCIAQVAVGRRPLLAIYGDDYPTPDGTCVRDYLHVMDLAEGHVSALEWLTHHRGVRAWNLGAGRGYSVRQMVSAFESTSGQPVPWVIEPRRPGDIAAYWADPSRARSELGWRVRRNLNAMMRDAWRWQSRNPCGYRS